MAKSETLASAAGDPVRVGPRIPVALLKPAPGYQTLDPEARGSNVRFSQQFEASRCEFYSGALGGVHGVYVRAKKKGGMLIFLPATAIASIRLIEPGEEASVELEEVVLPHPSAAAPKLSEEMEKQRQRLLAEAEQDAQERALSDQLAGGGQS